MKRPIILAFLLGGALWLAAVAIAAVALSCEPVPGTETVHTGRIVRACR